MSSQRNNRPVFSFFTMAAGAMALFKLKERYAQYKQVSADEEEGRVALTSPSVENINGEGNIALLDTEIPTPNRRTRKKRACCMCCGLDCSLLWKAIGVVLAGYTLYYGFKAIRWAVTDAPTGLEGMPAFGSSLGCADASFTYNNSAVTIMAPIGTRHHDHGFDVRGYGIGTVTIADGEADSKDVKYEITIKSNKEDILKDVSFVHPDVNKDGIVTRSRFIIETSQIPGVDTRWCMRYDVKISVPPKLKKLQISSHSTITHVQFAPGARLNIDELYVVLSTMDANNMILASEDVTPEKMSLEVYRGWIVGDASIVDETSISTQRGCRQPVLRTATGAGRSDFAFIGRKEFKRPIEANHISTRNADMYLTYRQAEFSGKIEMDSKSYTITGAQRLQDIGSHPKTAGEYNSGSDDTGKPKWTHFVGDKDGEDQIYVNSRGWTGLYF